MFVIVRLVDLPSQMPCAHCMSLGVKVQAADDECLQLFFGALIVQPPSCVSVIV